MPHYENTPFQIPNSWEWCKIKDIFQFSQGIQVDKGKQIFHPQEGYVRFLRIIDYTQNTELPRYIKEPGIKYHVKPEDLVMIRYGAPGTPCRGYEGVIANNLFRIIPHENTIIDLSYAFYFFSSSYFQSFCQSKGVALSAISFTTINDVLFTYPPFAEQKRIVAEIEKWFALIDELEANKQDLQQAIKQVKSKILDLAIHGKLVPQDPNDEPAIDLLRRINPNFTPCDTSHYQNLPSQWMACRLSDVIELLDNKRKPIKAAERAKRIEEKSILYPYYGATGFIGYIDEYLINGKFILLGEDGAPFLDKYAVKAYPVEGKIWVNNHAHILLPKIDFDYLKIYLNAFDYQKVAKGTTRLKLTQGDMNAIPILVPPFVEQKKISSCVETLFGTIDAISAEL